MNPFEVIDNPVMNAERAKILALEIKSIPYPGAEATKEEREEYWNIYKIRNEKTRAEQEQEVIDKRDLIEKFVQMLDEYKLAGEELEKFAQENDIPGVCGWEGVENWMNNDIIADAIQWASSDHSC